MSPTSTHYQVPGWFTRNLFNRAVSGLTRLGLPVAGSRILSTKGRRSGEIRTVPVNPVEVDGRTYLVSPRGVSQWVRNVRADDGRLGLGRGRTSHPYRATELTGDDALPVLRAYLARWGWEVGAFFDGVDKDATDDQLRAVMADHPVFLVQPAR